MFIIDAKTEMFKFARALGSHAGGGRSGEEEQQNTMVPWSTTARRNTISLGNNPPPQNLRAHNNSAQSARSFDNDFHDDYHHEDEEDEDEKSCDPLQYRLQHQKQYNEEKQNRRTSRRTVRRNSSLSRSSSTRGGKKERDPFDLWGSLTSEDTTRSQQRKLLDDESERSSHVDDVGWGSGTPSRRQVRRRSSRDLSISEREEDEDENDGGDLYVGFGGVTPQGTSSARRVKSACALDAMDENEPAAYSTPYHHPNTSSRHTFSARGNLQQDLLQVGFPQRHFDEGEDEDFHLGFPTRDDPCPQEQADGLDLGFPQEGRPQQEELNLGFPQRNPIASSHSTFSSVSANQMKDFDICGYGTDQSEGGGSRRASHADLANILSSLERESLSTASAELLVPTVTDSPSARKVAATDFSCCASTLSSMSPTEKAWLALAAATRPEPPLDLPVMPPDEGSTDSFCPINSKALQHEEESQHEQHYPWNQQGQQIEPCEQLSSSRQCPDQKRSSPSPKISPYEPQERPPSPKPPKVEEDDPQLAQLKRQTTEELRSELYSMQSQSKINLEKSWAETEKMRVENSELDDKLETLRKELSVAKAAMLSGGGLRRMSTHSDNAGGGTFITKLRSSDNKKPKKGGFRRRQTIAGEEGQKGGFCRRPTFDGVLNNNMMADLLSLRSDFMGGGAKKSSDPSSNPSDNMRRSTSVKSLANLCLEETENDLDASWSNRSTVTSYVDQAMTRSRPSLSRGSFLRENNITPVDTFPEQACNDECSKASSSKASEQRGSFRRNSFIGSLTGQGFLKKQSSARSVDSYASLASALGLGIDESQYDDCSDVSSQKTKEFNEEIYMSLLAQPESDPTPNNNFGRNESSHSIYSEESIDAVSGVFYPPPSSGKSTDESDAKSGVFYPPPAEESVDDNEDEEDAATYYGGQSVARGGQSVCPSICPSVADTVGMMSNMDDFDFDPLNENTAVSTVPMKNHAPRRNSSGTSASGKNKRNGGPVRRPSFMSLFDPNDFADSDDDSDSSPTPPPPRKPRKAKKSSAILSALILQKERDIKKLGETLSSQEEKIVACEAEIVGAGIQNRESDNLQMEEEATLQAKVKELEELEYKIESRLEDAEESEQIAKEKELALQEELLLVNDNYQSRASEIKLENELNKFQEQYNTIQENAIEQLSGLLKEFDSIGIPSLRGDMEDDVAGEIIARFDSLTDKEEELVCILSDVDRRTSCQASFQQIQQNIETAIFWKNQLGVLESDLRGSLGTIVMMMKKENGDEMTSTTESSTASERLSLERLFVEAMLAQLESVEQKQGRFVLDALSGSLDFLSYWDQWLVPDYFTSSMDAPSSNGNLDAVISSILKAKAELEEAKLDILNEQAKFQAKMKRSGIRLCTLKSAQEPGHNDSDQQLTATPSLDRQSSECASSDVIGGLNNQLSQANDLLSRRETMMEQYSSFFRSVRPQAAPQTNSSFLEDILEEDDPGQLNELDEEISEEARILSQQEDVLNGYTLQLESMQAQAQEDSENHMRLTDEIQMKIKHILTKLAEEESLVEYLEEQVYEKRRMVTELEAQLQEPPTHDYDDDR